MTTAKTEKHKQPNNANTIFHGCGYHEFHLVHYKCYTFLLQVVFTVLSFINFSYLLKFSHT